MKFNIRQETALEEEQEAALRSLNHQVVWVRINEMKVCLFGPYGIEGGDTEKLSKGGIMKASCEINLVHFFWANSEWGLKLRNRYNLLSLLLMQFYNDVSSKLIYYELTQYTISILLNSLLTISVQSIGNTKSANLSQLAIDFMFPKAMLI